MKAPRKLLVILGTVVALLVITALALPFFVDADRFRPMAETQARAALGRDVKIGKLELSLWSGGVKAHDVTIADDPAFSRSAFVHARGLNIGVEMWPLIVRKAVHVTSLAVVEPEIVLIKSAGGKWNFDSLGAHPPASAGGGGASPVSVRDLKIEDGRIVVQRGAKKSVYEKVNARMQDFSATTAFPFSLTAETPGGGSVKVEGKAGPLSAGDMTATPVSVTAQVKGLDLAATGFVAPETGIAGKLDYQGKIDSDGKVIRSEGQATASGLKLVKGGAPARAPVVVDYASHLNVAEKRGEITRGDIATGANHATLSGTFDTKGDTVNVNARLKGDNLPINAVAGLLPAFGVVLPQGSQLQGGTVSTDMLLQGPVDKLVITGPIKVANTKVSGFNLKSRASGISALAGIPSTSDLLVQALNSRLRVAPEGIRAEGIQLVVPQIGSVAGEGTIGANSALNFRMRARLAGGGGLVGGLSALSTLGQSKGEIPFLIQGTTANPIFVPDVAGALTSTAKAPVQTVQGVGGVLGGLFGKKKKK